MKRRPAYTLLEVMLALAIAVLLLGALYTAVGYQLRHAQAGRELIGQATLARAVFGRLTSDVSATAGLVDPTRFRNPPNLSNSASGGSSGAAGSGSTTGGATTGGASAGAGATGGSTSGGAAASSTTTSSTTTSTTTQNIISLPLGVIGDSQTLNLFVSLVPGEVWGTSTNDQGVLTSDLRRIVYWLDSNGGLCRQEVKVVTSQDALTTDIPTGDPASHVLAPEVRSVEFSYFDGTNWNDTWDSTMITGTDGVTPQGSPRAIAVKIGMVPHGTKDGDGKQAELKHYRHVIAITSANGATPLTQPNPNNPAVTAAQSSTTGTNSSTGTTGN